MIGIIGGGHVGITLYLDCKAAGAAAAVYTSDPQRHAGQRIQFTDMFSGEAANVLATPGDFRSLDDERLVQSSVVFLTVPDIPDLRIAAIDLLFRRFAGTDLLLIIIRAGQGGAFWLTDALRDERAAGWTSVLIEDSLYGCRKTGTTVEYKRKKAVKSVVHRAGGMDVPTRLKTLLPHIDWERVLVASEAVDLLFAPLGYYIHAAVALDGRNVARTARGEKYLHYSEGIDPTLAVCLADMDTERVALAASLGATAETFPEILYRQYSHPSLDSFYETMAATRRLYKSMSAESLEGLRRSRSLREDIPALATIVRLAQSAGFSMPITASFFASLPYALRRVGLDATAVPLYPEVPRGVTAATLPGLLALESDG